MGRIDAVHTVVDTPLEVFAHNIETVESLTPCAFVMPRADYRQSLRVLEVAKQQAAGCVDEKQPDARAR